MHLEGTFLTVDRLVSGSNFTTVRTDSHPSTKFQWLRTGGGLSSTSEVTITWYVILELSSKYAESDKCLMQDDRARNAGGLVSH